MKTIELVDKLLGDCSELSPDLATEIVQVELPDETYVDIKEVFFVEDGKTIIRLVSNEKMASHNT